MNSREIEWVLFDLDGTLLDSLPGIAFSVQSAFEACQLPLSHRELREMIGPPIRSILSKAGNLLDETKLDALERAFRASYDTLGWQKTVCFPEVRSVLQSLSQLGTQLYVVSNKPREICLKTLKRECILDYFESILTRDSRRPAFSGKEEMIRNLLNERRITEPRCLLVGDTMEDANAAAAAGIHFAFVTYGYGVLEETNSAPVKWRLDKLSELLDPEPGMSKPTENSHDRQGHL